MTTSETFEPKTGPRADTTPSFPTDTPQTPELIRRAVTEDRLCVLTFDRPKSAANVFDKATLLQLRAHLQAIAAEPQLQGLILGSAKKSIFIAGADLHSLSRASGPSDLREIVELGQEAFNLLADLKIPTAAAIHGACVGGGYEICLACDYRLASTDKATKIGLPEIQLGILPAWGGCTRLPRLVGLPRALDVILAGKTLAPKQALKHGLVDELVPREYLLEVARKKLLAAKGKPARSRPLKVKASNTPLVAAVLRKRLQPTLLKKTRGHYPAVLKALEVVTRGISKSREAALALERDAIAELAQTETCRNLIRVFLLQERAKKLDWGAPATTRGQAGASSNNQAIPAARAPVSAAEPAALPAARRIAVIGAGVMGAGIAQWASARELQVILRDINSEAVAKGLAAIAELYEQGVKRHVFTRLEARAGLDRISPTPVDVPLKHVDIVIEAAVEKMDLKKQIFARLADLAGPNTILATNTSALSVSELAESTKHPGRVVGIHFFNPVHRMQLVEVIVGRHTEPAVVQRAVRFVQQLGKLPVVVKDSPGFLVNRILMPYLLEAGHLFECGARVEDIDACMLDFGMPMGPLRLLDEVGLDVSHHVAETVAAHFSSRFAKPAALEDMIRAGLLGKKSGQGFYVYRGKSDKPSVNPQIDKFHRNPSAANLSRNELQDRMVLLMLNEAAHCLEEGLVAEPADVDFGMIMGTGFAPFLGGPLRLADFVGLDKLVQRMETLVMQGERRFEPCELMRAMARDGRKFYQSHLTLSPPQPNYEHTQPST